MGYCGGVFSKSYIDLLQCRRIYLQFVTIIFRCCRPCFEGLGVLALGGSGCPWLRVSGVRQVVALGVAVVLLLGCSCPLFGCFFGLRGSALIVSGCAHRGKM